MTDLSEQRSIPKQSIPQVSVSSIFTSEKTESILYMLEDLQNSDYFRELHVSFRHSRSGVPAGLLLWRTDRAVLRSSGHSPALQAGLRTV